MRRSELHLNSEGLLYCDCVDALEDKKQLEEDNRALAQPRPRPPDPGGSIDGHDYTDPNPNWRDAMVPVGTASNYKP